MSSRMCRTGALRDCAAIRSHSDARSRHSSGGIIMVPENVKGEENTATGHGPESSGGSELHALLHPFNKHGRNLAKSRSGVRPKSENYYLLGTGGVLQASYPGRLGNASTMGTKVRPPCSSAMTTASAPNDLFDLMASAHNSLVSTLVSERPP